MERTTERGTAERMLSLFVSVKYGGRSAMEGVKEIIRWVSRAQKTRRPKKKRGSTGGLGREKRHKENLKKQS